MRKLTTSSLLVSLVCTPALAFGQDEQMLTFSTTGFALMVAAYLVLWVLVAGFVATLIRRQKLANAKLESLHATLEKHVSTLE